MKFNEHLDLKGQHAFLGASKYHWLNYDEDKLVQTYLSSMAAKKGTELHEFASKAIELGIKLSGSKKTLNRYVNDAIGFKMIPEQVLYFSPNCFGTADAISFRDKMLRIHDLKTGSSATSMMQLEIYAAIFCLEYKQDPEKIGMNLRIYQSDEVIEHEPFPPNIQEIMNKIIVFDKRIEELNMGV